MPLGQGLGRQVLVNLHVADGQGHVPPLVVDEEVGGGPPAGDDGGLGDVDAQLPAAGGQLLGVQVVPEGGQQPHVQAQQGHVVGDVPPYTPQGGVYGPGVGIPGDQRRLRAAPDVHVDAPDDGDIGRGLDNVALSGDIALFHQVGDMHGDGGAGNPRLVRQLLLGDEGVFLDPVEQLPFPLGHGPPPYKQSFSLLI